MADQVREAGFLTGELSAVLKDAPDHHSVVLSVGDAKALIAATASHAAEVEALRSALRAVLAVVEDPKNYRIWAADLLTCCYTAPAFDAARAALKGDKP